MATPYNMRAGLLRAGDASANVLTDPGSGGTIVVRPFDLAQVTLTGAGARTLESASAMPLGARVLVLSQTNAITCNSVTIDDGEHVEFLVTLDSSGNNQWVQASQDANVDALEDTVYRTITEELKPEEFRVHDALGTLLSAGAGATDDLGLTIGVIGTSRSSLNATVDDAALTQEGVVFWTVPQTYIAGEDLTLTVDFTRTAAADTSATIDAEVYRAAAASTDICGAADDGDINSAASGTVTFTITGTTVNPGDDLHIRLVAAIDDSGGATAASVWEFNAYVAHTVPNNS